MRIVTIVGARPQFIKAAPVSRALAAAGAREICVHTGQHFDPAMSQVFFDELELAAPACNLGIHSLTHGAMTGRMLEGIETVLSKEAPDWVLVYGDTDSTLAGALAAAKLHIPVAHVEAGLRSFNRRMPEEINRVLTDHVSDLLLVPTVSAVENLRREGIAGDKVRLVGDVMYDAALHFGDIAGRDSRILERLSLDGNRYVLATMHRPENTDHPSRLSLIFGGLTEIARETRVVVPLHPRTRKTLAPMGVDLSRLEVIDPVGYLDMTMLEKNAAVIVTDSGGIQKEAYFHGVPCVTVRDQTEWVELIEAGWNRLCVPERVRDTVIEAMTGRRPGGPRQELYGDGHAAGKIAAELLARGKTS